MGCPGGLDELLIVSRGPVPIYNELSREVDQLLIVSRGLFCPSNEPARGVSRGAIYPITFIHVF